MASDIKSDISTANQLLTETSVRCMKGFGYIWSFRHIAELGLKSSFGQIADDSYSFIQLLPSYLKT